MLRRPQEPNKIQKRSVELKPDAGPRRYCSVIQPRPTNSQKNQQKNISPDHEPEPILPSPGFPNSAEVDPLFLSSSQLNPPEFSESFPSLHPINADSTRKPGSDDRNPRSGNHSSSPDSGPGYRLCPPPDPSPAEKIHLTVRKELSVAETFQSVILPTTQGIIFLTVV